MHSQKNLVFHIYNSNSIVRCGTDFLPIAMNKDIVDMLQVFPYL